jgi:uncharacterized protein YraI
MQIRNTIFVAALAAAAAVPGAALADIVASATTPLNVRSGPGPQFPVIGVIPENGRATIRGCIEGSLWCHVTFKGEPGWAYSQYLSAQLSGRELVIAEGSADVPVVAYEAPPVTVGTTAPAPVVSGRLIQRPAAGPPLVITPPPATVREYVVSNPVEPVYLEGEVVLGAGVPETVTLTPVPGSPYQYAYVNRVPVLVEPSSRAVTYVYR